MGIFGGGFTTQGGGTFGVDYNRQDEQVRRAKKEFATERRIEGELGPEKTAFENDQRNAQAEDMYSRYGMAQAQRSIGMDSLVNGKAQQKSFLDKVLNEAIESVFNKMF